MKEFTGGRRVVIVNQKGMGNIEQAIFILKKDVKDPDGDYILDEAKKIVDEFVARNKSELNRCGLGAKWIFPAVAAVSAVVGLYVYFLL